MKKKNELNYKDLKMTCSPDLFRFDTTEELSPKIGRASCRERV